MHHRQTRQTERQTDGQMGGWMDGHKDRWTYLNIIDWILSIPPPSPMSSYQCWMLTLHLTLIRWNPSWGPVAKEVVYMVCVIYTKHLEQNLFFKRLEFQSFEAFEIHFVYQDISVIFVCLYQPPLRRQNRLTDKNAPRWVPDLLDSIFLVVQYSLVTSAIILILIQTAVFNASRLTSMTAALISWPRTQPTTTAIC